MLVKAALIIALLAVPNWRTANGVIVGEGIASAYKPWRKSRYVPNARYAGRWRVKPTAQDLVCAHRTLPFGTILRLQLVSSRRVAVCVVLDRGPYGFCEEREDKTKRYSRQCPVGHRYVVAVRRNNRRGWYRGIIDATPAVHRMMGVRGWVRVTVTKLSGVRQRRVLRANR